MSVLKRSLLKKCFQMEIPLVGIANVERWRYPPFQPWIPEDFFPQSIYTEAKSVIVIGLPITLPVLETSPSIYYHELYNTVNSLLDQYTYRLSNFLDEKGYPSLFVPRDGYAGINALQKDPIAFFSHRHAALLAGLGTFGVNNVLLTPQFGPRVRFGSILTTASIPPDPMIKEDLCTRCMICVGSCPVQALAEDAYPQSITDKRACVAQSLKLYEQGISPCGICIKVCPVGKDRKLFHRSDISIYNRKERRSELQKAWEHARAYGRK